MNENQKNVQSKLPIIEKLINEQEDLKLILSKLEDLATKIMGKALRDEQRTCDNTNMDEIVDYNLYMIRDICDLTAKINERI